MSIVEKRDKYAKSLPYREFRAKEMEEIATYSSKSDDCWHVLGETLHDQYGYDVKETEEMIYRAFFENIIDKDRIKALEQVKKKIQTENDGLDFLIAMCYMAIEKYSKANSIIEEIADRTQDESAVAMLDMMDDSLAAALYGKGYDDDEWDHFAGVEMNEPYQRETKKIGRNDPCPCGSGKKYKKCCGR